MEKTTGGELLVTGRREVPMFRRPAILILAALTAAILFCLAEWLALGAVRHVEFVVNALLTVLLLASADAAIALFQAGWFRFGPEGYKVNIPWKGLRGGCTWDQVDFAALIPGDLAMNRCETALLILEKGGNAVALEYRERLLDALLSRCPQLHIAALPESDAVKAYCRDLDRRNIGWLPLMWIRHADGSGELKPKPAETRPEHQPAPWMPEPRMPEPKPATARVRAVRRPEEKQEEE